MLKEAAEIRYPFIPRSTAHLLPGQFWAIPLEDGRFACGRVIQLHSAAGYRDQFRFLAGLQDWVGNSPPSAKAIAGTQVLEQGQTNLKTILQTGGKILGHRPLNLDGIGPALFYKDVQGQGIKLMRGYEIIGRAFEQDRNTLLYFPLWEINEIKVRAEQVFGGIRETGPLKARSIRRRARRRLRYYEISKQVKFELFVDDVQVVILNPQRKRGPDANLIGFKPWDKLIWRLEAPVKKDPHGYDGFVNLHILDGKVWVYSWSGFHLRIDHRTGKIEEMEFTK